MRPDTMQREKYCAISDDGAADENAAFCGCDGAMRALHVEKIITGGRAARSQPDAEVRCCCLSARSASACNPLLAASFDCRLARCDPPGAELWASEGTSSSRLLTRRQRWF